MYREFAPPSDAHLIACTWQASGRSAADVLVVPDGCMDILWNGRALWVAGPDTRAVREQCGGRDLVALRFVPGCAPLALGLPASALRDARVPLEELWGERARALADALADAAGGAAGRALLAQSVRASARQRAPDPLVRALIERLRRGLLSARAEPEPRIDALAAELGVSERQLHRRCTANVGYGPKLLARILRLRAFERALRAHRHVSIAELAAGLGYADQAHATHDARALFATTPARMRARQG